MAVAFSGRALRAARHRSRIPATKLAAAAQRCTRTVRGYEVGAVQPPVDVAIRLATELGLDLADLLVDDTTPKRGAA